MPGLVETVGQQFFGAVGVSVGLAARMRVVHNEIRHVPYTGVSVGWRWDPRPTPVRENLVRDNVLEVAEGIPHVRYNRTHPENIRQVGRILKRGSPEDQAMLEKAVAGARARTGPRRPLEGP